MVAETGRAPNDRDAVLAPNAQAAETLRSADAVAAPARTGS